MEKQQGPKGFLVVLPGEVIEIPQDSYKSWLTLFYSLPQEFVSKCPAYMSIPRCPYEVLRTDKYDDLINSDTFLEVVWDSYSWVAWQFFNVPDKGGKHREIPGSRAQYSGDFPLWRMSYNLIPYMRMKFETNGLSFQSLYNIPQGMEVPWLTYQQFGNLVGNLTDRIVAEQHWQPVIDEIWNNRQVADYDNRNSVVKTDFMRKWHHDRKSKPLSLEQIQESGGALDNETLTEIPDPSAEFESKILSEIQLDQFRATLTDRDRAILRMRMAGCTQQEIADKVGFKTASAVSKHIDKLSDKYRDFVGAEYEKYLDSLSKPKQKNE